MSKFPKRWQNTLCHNCQWFYAYPVRNEHGEDWQWECNHPTKNYAEDISNLKPYCENCSGFNWKLETVNNDH